MCPAPQPMAEVKPLYSTCVAVLGFICFVVGATAVGIPVWGYFDASYPISGPNWGGRSSFVAPPEEHGYFGPWKTCKILVYNRERCEKGSSRFRPNIAVWVAGIVGAIAVSVLGIFCILSVIQLAMLSSKEKIVMKYSTVVFVKLALGLLAMLLSIAVAGLFALEADNSDTNGIHITRGPGFYLQILVIVLTSVLFIMSIYDVIFSRRDGGDPTKITVPMEATTYGNPGFRERGTNGASVSMTDASGKPYASNGSMASMNTASTTMGSVASTNGSTVGSSVTRSPLRSSLKKPKPKEGLGIQNPGFSGTSPTLSRNGSTKKVRIQTHSTEV